MDYALFQKLTEHELDRYLCDIDLTIEFHLKWLSQVNRALVCSSDCDQSQAQDLLSQTDHFSRWYDGVQYKDLFDIPAFQALGEIHSKTLQLGRDLVSISLKKENISCSEYDRFISYTSELHQQINTLKNKIKSDLTLKAKLMGKVFENAEEGVMITDAESVILNVNRSFERVTRYTKDEALGKKPSMLHSGNHDEGFYERMWAVLKRENRWQGEIWNRRKNNEIYPEWLSITAVHDDKGDISHYIGIFSDVSTESEGDERLYHLAHYDNLCNLPNRLLFYDRLQQALTRVKRSRKRFVVMFLDLDDFKKINDKYGHHVGDEVLQQVSKRLIDTLRETDTIARIGGDEFTFIISDVDDIDSITAVARKVQNVIQENYTLNDHVLSLSASLGISGYPDNIDKLNTLVKQADLAMYKAKEGGKNCFRFFDPGME